MNEQFKITGRYRTIVKRANGKVEVSEWQNTIHSELKEAVNDAFLASQNYALDNLFSAVATPPASGKDGIVMYGASHWYSSTCSTSEPTSTSTKVTGVFTGVAATISDIALGFNHAGTDSDSFAVNFADPTTWNNITLTSDDTLTVEWTITVS